LIYALVIYLKFRFGNWKNLKKVWRVNCFPL
jgi:hypothetical protein